MELPVPSAEVDEIGVYQSRSEAFDRDWLLMGYLTNWLGLCLWFSVNHWGWLASVGLAFVISVVNLVRSVRERNWVSKQTSLRCIEDGIQVSGWPTTQILNKNGIQAGLAFQTDDKYTLLLQHEWQHIRLSFDSEEDLHSAMEALCMAGDHFGTFYWRQVQFRWRTMAYHSIATVLVVPWLADLWTSGTSVLFPLFLILGLPAFTSFCYEKTFGIEQNLGETRIVLEPNRVTFADPNLSFRYSEIKSILRSENQWLLTTHESTEPVTIHLTTKKYQTPPEDEDLMFSALTHLIELHNSEDYQKFKVSEQIQQWARSLYQPELPWGFNVGEVANLVQASNYREQAIPEHQLWQAISNPHALPEEQTLAAHLLLLHEPQSRQRIVNEAQTNSDKNAREMILESVQCSDLRKGIK
jgi:hypothetical protein